MAHWTLFNFQLHTKFDLSSKGIYWIYRTSISGTKNSVFFFLCFLRVLVSWICAIKLRISIVFVIIFTQRTLSVNYWLIIQSHSLLIYVRYKYSQNNTNTNWIWRSTLSAFQRTQDIRCITNRSEFSEVKAAFSKSVTKHFRALFKNHFFLSLGFLCPVLINCDIDFVFLRPLLQCDAHSLPNLYHSHTFWM